MILSKYKKFISDLSESLDTSNIDIKWIDKPDRLIGLFVVGNNTYQLDFNRVGDAWSYKFYLASRVNGKLELSPDMTGINTDKYKVLSMSKSGLIYMLENKKPNAIVFAAVNEKDSKKIKVGDSKLTKRQHIYLMLLEQIPDLYPDYLYDIDNTENNQIYVIYRKDLKNPDETNNNIQEIIKSYISSHT